MLCYFWTFPYAQSNLCDLRKVPESWSKISHVFWHIQGEFSIRIVIYPLSEISAVETQNWLWNVYSLFQAPPRALSVHPSIAVQTAYKVCPVHRVHQRAAWPNGAEPQGLRGFIVAVHRKMVGKITTKWQLLLRIFWNIIFFLLSFSPGFWNEQTVFVLKTPSHLYRSVKIVSSCLCFLCQIYMEAYFLSSQKSRPSLFSTPLILPVEDATTNQDLYQLVWTQVRYRNIPEYSLVFLTVFFILVANLQF